MYEGKPWPEDSDELRDLIALGRAERPAIADLDIWNEIKPYVVHGMYAGASRQHVYLMTQTPEKFINRWKKRPVRCSNPDCNDLFPCIRKHLNGKQWSIHVSGPLNGHPQCRNRNETRMQTLWLYLVTGQAMRSPRVARARKDARQSLFDFLSELEDR